MKRTILALAVLCLAPFSRAADSEEGFVPIMDGKTFEGWKIGDASANSWTIQDGAFVAKGPRSHLFYVGGDQPFKDFELKVDVMTRPGSNGGIYFHTRYQDTGWPSEGIECQVNVTQQDWIKTGSLYGVVNIGLTPAQDNQWWTQHIIVRGNRVTVRIDGKTVIEYIQPRGAQSGRRLGEGTFALQAHDPGSEIHYKNIRVKRL